MSNQNSELYKNEQINKFKNHIKQFKISDSIFLRLFEELLVSSDNYRLECSCKIVNEKIYPCRFNVCYSGREHLKNIKLSLGLIKKFSNHGALINYDLQKKIFLDGLDSSKIEKVIVGIDIREDIAASRVKFWIEIGNDYYQMFNKVLELHGNNSKVDEVIYGNELHFGFDFGFDGSSKIKIYPCLEKYHLNNKIIFEKLKQVFSPKIITLITYCQSIYLTYDGKYHERSIVFKPENLVLFLEILRNDKLNELTKSINNSFSNCLVTIKERELNENKISQLNFYY